jgi:hypothetical protein
MRRWIIQQATLLTLCQLDVLDIAMSDGDSSRIRSWLRMRLHSFFLLPSFTQLLELKDFRKEVGAPAPLPAPCLTLAKDHLTGEASLIMGEALVVFSSLVTEPHQVDDRFSQPQRSFKNSSFALTFRLRHGGSCSVMQDLQVWFSLMEFPVLVGTLDVNQSLLRARKHFHPFKNGNSYPGMTREVQVSLKGGGSVTRLGHLSPKPGKFGQRERPPNQGFKGSHPLKRPD